MLLSTFPRPIEDDLLGGWGDTTDEMELVMLLTILFEAVDRPRAEPVLERGPGATDTGEEAVNAEAAIGVGVSPLILLESDSCH
jgi:hypothetical protein